MNYHRNCLSVDFKFELTNKPFCTHSRQWNDLRNFKHNGHFLRFGLKRLPLSVDDDNCWKSFGGILPSSELLVAIIKWKLSKMAPKQTCSTSYDILSRYFSFDYPMEKETTNWTYDFDWIWILFCCQINFFNANFVLFICKCTFKFSDTFI